MLDSPAKGLEAEPAALPVLRKRYNRLRASLETLLAQPVKDMPAVDRLVDELETVQLQIKAALGIRGNNPLE